MDQNMAERTLRTPVGGRKNSDGSGSVWRAPLAARMFRVVPTILLWGLTPPHWLSACFPACADHGGTCPTDLRAFLPWELTLERREERARPVPVPWSSLTDQAQEGDEMAVIDTSEDRFYRVA